MNANEIDVLLFDVLGTAGEGEPEPADNFDLSVPDLAGGPRR
jgi:hypothetical protein